jgi:hypothetical protein
LKFQQLTVMALFYYIECAIKETEVNKILCICSMYCTVEGQLLAVRSRLHFCLYNIFFFNEAIGQTDGYRYCTASYRPFLSKETPTAMRDT